MRNTYLTVISKTALMCLMLLSSACFEEGDYASAYQNGDYERSLYLLKKQAASNPDAYVHNLLGVHHELGLATRRDYDEAFKWYQQAALEDLPEAQLNLARMIENGRGTTADPVFAYGWYWAAFHAGHQSALPFVQNLSGQLYPHLIDVARQQVGEILGKDLTVVN